MLVCDPYGRPLCPFCRSVMIRGRDVKNSTPRMATFSCPDPDCAHSSDFLIPGKPRGSGEGTPAQG